MADFSHLSQFDVRLDKTSRYVLYQISGEPVLIVAPATEANKPYFNAVLKRARRSSRAIQAGAVNLGMISENRTEDRQLYPEHIVVGWDGVVDKDKNPVDFSLDNCRAFLRALPDWIFDDLRQYCGNPNNFVDQIDVEDVAKN